MSHEVSVCLFSFIDDTSEAVLSDNSFHTCSEKKYMKGSYIVKSIITNIYVGSLCSKFKMKLVHAFVLLLNDILLCLKMYLW
jgi:hypothetical protein